MQKINAMIMTTSSLNAISIISTLGTMAHVGKKYAKPLFKEKLNQN
jgi:hypothetical protein